MRDIKSYAMFQRKLKKRLSTNNIQEHCKSRLNTYFKCKDSRFIIYANEIIFENLKLK